LLLSVKIIALCGCVTQQKTKDKKRPPIRHREKFADGFAHARTADANNKLRKPAWLKTIKPNSDFRSFFSTNARLPFDTSVSIRLSVSKSVEDIRHRKPAGRNLRRFCPLCFFSKKFGPASRASLFSSLRSLLSYFFKNQRESEDQKTRKQKTESLRAGATETDDVAADDVGSDVAAIRRTNVDLIEVPRAAPQHAILSCIGT